MRATVLFLLFVACDSSPSHPACHDFPVGHECCMGPSIQGGCQDGLVCFNTGPGVGTECLQPCGSDLGVCSGGMECRIHRGTLANIGCFCTLPGDVVDPSDGGICP
jgi:hypothetical protein